ncbi:NLI interacting factor-like phosphatase family protein [Histomonas meleagridis]|uniref:NLI interacting factor-like phosphatase family protein n=1 Tax=Histomonas meleagridis TaxID=135588 RepID=UPI0035595108|nr:NLI interacting factor-like phosphatase family protein [Histomonas meleagridis]KAH0805322.1 NLI interacting factor-like phosphatase family protein [Histomonas meleagridis]
MPTQENEGIEINRETILRLESEIKSPINEQDESPMDPKPTVGYEIKTETSRKNTDFSGAKNTPRADSAEIVKYQNNSSTLLPPIEGVQKKICLVLDLDETLVHSSFQETKNPDYSFLLNVGNGTEVPVSVNIRPGAKEFLKTLGSLFELVIFTASCKPYADQVINFIDEDHNIKHRLYRDSCTEYGGHFVKDLSRLNRKLEKVIIVDNSPTAYLFQPYNAIAISSWFDEKTDNELFSIMNFLKNSYRVRNIYNLFSYE